ncbi:hypothetical protein BRADI_4g32065v3 [Brachypodium distachyon]|uniref:Uncharacterized protein n=1 Tax=Brachypodium distachyon TaxID=15368 RepID=A0A2K2CRS2_BRADI|nr:hypothetical protein BRADI_4g32065v3 [Brachypodium distachyon]
MHQPSLELFGRKTGGYCLLPSIEKEYVGQDACILTTHANGLARKGMYTVRMTQCRPEPRPRSSSLFFDGRGIVSDFIDEI